MNALESLFFIRAELLVLTVALVVLLADFFVTKKAVLGWVSVAGLLAACFVPMKYFPPQGLFFGYFALDPFTHFFRLFAFWASALVILVSLSYPKIAEKQRGEFCVLILALAVLLPIMAGAVNLLMIYLAIESVSIASYLLTGFQKYDKKSSEAALKYLLFGSISSAVMLLGMSFLFGATRSIWLNEIAAQLALDNTLHSIGLLGLVLILVGLGFKISMVPFHMWAPDVYQGAPTPVTAFLTVAPKALGFAVTVRVLFTAFPNFFQNWSYLLTWLSILTMTVGNVIAISQSDVKRLLAFSSIAQAGYILAGLAVPGALGLEAVLIYLAAYLVTNLGAFFTVLAIERNLGSNQLEDYRGLSEKSPLTALCFMFFLLSLTGIPPLAGFIGKLYIFAAAVSARQIMLAIAIAVNSAIAAYYYFRILRMMYLEKAEFAGAIRHPFPVKLSIALTLLGTLFIGLFPNYVIQFVEKSLAHFPFF